MPIERRRGLGIGAVFFSIFGAMWVNGGAELAYGKKTFALSAMIWAIAALILLAAIRVIRANQLPPADATIAAKQARHSKVFMLVNLVQYSAMFILVQVLHWTSHADWVVPGVMLIVGLHFFPLARLFSYRPHHVTGAALVLLALIYPFAGSGPLDPIGCIGAGLILWGAAVFGLAGASAATWARA
jgi:hypothetical protein